MTLQISLPLGKKEGVKNLVFTILIGESPLKLIELTNFIRKRYGKAVTFQAVRKAALELVEESVIIRKNNEFYINKEWVLESKKIIDNLYNALYIGTEKPRKFDSIGDEISVFTFNSLSEMMKFWENLIDDWFIKFKRRDYNINCYQSAHVWEILLYPETEKKIMGQMKDKGVISYVLSTGNTPLDKSSASFYRKIGVKVAISPSSSSFDKEYLVGTYGDLIVQTRLPKEFVLLIDDFYRKNKKLEDLNINDLSDIINKKIKIKLTVIKNLEMAKQINRSIISQIE